MKRRAIIGLTIGLAFLLTAGVALAAVYNGSTYFSSVTYNNNHFVDSSKIDVTNNGTTAHHIYGVQHNDVSPSYGQVVYQRWYGTSRKLVKSLGGTPGVTGRNAYSPTVLATNGTKYFAWIESYKSGSKHYYQLVFQSQNSSGAWSGKQYLETATFSLYHPVIILQNGKPGVIWTHYKAGATVESEETSYLLYKQWNGSSWVLKNLSGNTTGTAAETDASCIKSGNNAYVVWTFRPAGSSTTVVKGRKIVSGVPQAIKTFTNFNAYEPCVTYINGAPFVTFDQYIYSPTYTVKGWLYRYIPSTNSWKYNTMSNATNIQFAKKGSYIFSYFVPAYTDTSRTSGIYQRVWTGSGWASTSTRIVPTSVEAYHGFSLACDGYKAWMTDTDFLPAPGYGESIVMLYR